MGLDDALTRAERALAGFETDGHGYRIEPYGNGHINATYLVTPEGAGRRYILQKLNARVFPHPEQVMENISRVTRYLRERIEARGGDTQRETLTLTPARAGGDYVVVEGDLYRLYWFVEDTISYDLPDTPALFERCGESFGGFQRALDGFPAETLHEVIPNFHHTPKRLDNLKKAAQADVCGRFAGVRAEFENALALAQSASALTDALARGDIPLRVTHNDTKLNNILMDARTGASVCVIDLDTVMPGLAAYDFGDSIRTGANAAAEDETDLEKVFLDRDMYAAYLTGFLRGCGGALTPREIALLPVGARLMTLECGLRFLTDYLDGDVYFRIHHPGHNLERARCQFKLVRSMDEHWAWMQTQSSLRGGEDT